MKSFINKNKLFAALGTVIVLHSANNFGIGERGKGGGQKGKVSMSKSAISNNQKPVDKNAEIIHGLNDQLSAANDQIAALQSQYGDQLSFSNDLQNQIQALVAEQVKAKNLSKQHEKLAIEAAVASTIAAMLAYLGPKIYGMFDKDLKGKGFMERWNKSDAGKPYRITYDKLKSVGLDVKKFVKSGMTSLDDRFESVRYGYPKADLRKMVDSSMIKEDDVLNAAKTLLGLPAEDIDAKTEMNTKAADSKKARDAAIKTLVDAEFFKGVKSGGSYTEGDKVELSLKSKKQIEESDLKLKQKKQKGDLENKQKEEEDKLELKHNKALERVGSAKKSAVEAKQAKEKASLKEKLDSQNKKLTTQHENRNF